MHKKWNSPQLRKGTRPIPGRISYRHGKYNSINFNSRCLVITENLYTLSNQVRIIVPYKEDTGSNGNIMPLHIYKNYFLGQQKNNWWQEEIKKFN